MLLRIAQHRRIDDVYVEVEPAQADECFRTDLYYRINVIAFDLPPLTDRREDIPLLVDHFIEQLNAEKGRSVRGLSRGTMERLMRYGYPGNIRELRNIIEHAYVLCRCDEIQELCLPPGVLAATDAAAIPRPSATGETALQQPAAQMVNLRRLAPDREQALIAETLSACGGRKGEAANRLGINPATLWRKMKKYGMT